MSNEHYCLNAALLMPIIVHRWLTSDITALSVTLGRFQFTIDCRVLSVSDMSGQTIHRCPNIGRRRGPGQGIPSGPCVPAWPQSACTDGPALLRAPLKESQSPPAAAARRHYKSMWRPSEGSCSRTGSGARGGRSQRRERDSGRHHEVPGTGESAVTWADLRWPRMT